MQTRFILVAILLWFMWAQADAAESTSITIAFHVEAQPLADAVAMWAQQSGLQLIWPTERLTAMDRIADRVAGQFAPAEALSLLLRGTGFTFSFVDAHTVVIQPDVAGLTQPTGKLGGERDRPEGLAPARSARVAMADRSDVVDASRVARDGSIPNATDTLQEVVVTGSRLRRAANGGAQDVRIYSREDIEKTGRSSVAEFFNTLSSVSVASTGNIRQSTHTTVTLRGLPVGTTLVLINGRRLQTSGTEGVSDYFDLSNIPLAAVDRIEVVADGSSAVYGSDAIGGVVNIILRKDFDGIDVSVQYGAAEGVDESRANAALGRTWERGAASIIASYQKRSELTGSERKLTASNDYSSYGGTNNNFAFGPLANVFSLNGQPLPGAPAGSNASFAAYSGTATSGRASFSDFSYGALHTMGTGSITDLLPESERTGVIIQGSYKLTPSTELFVETMYSRSKQLYRLGPISFSGTVASQSFRVSAANPYNPFGVDVGFTKLESSLPGGNFETTDFLNVVAGAKGKFRNAWRWQVSAGQSSDWTTLEAPYANFDTTAFRSALSSPDPAIALNPFTAGPMGPKSFFDAIGPEGIIKYSGRNEFVNAFLTGPILSRPAGAVEAVMGVEYDRKTLKQNVVRYPSQPANTRIGYDRDSYAVFAETRIPLLSSSALPSLRETLAASLAARYNHDGEFGDVTTPQAGIEWRPTTSLLARATYAEAFKAPPLPQLYSVQLVRPNTAVTDPILGGRYNVTLLSGGNPDLQPSTGQSHTFGLVYTSQAIPNLQLSLTNWYVEQDDVVQSFNTQFIVDHEAFFPNRVVRDGNGTITTVSGVYINFGAIDVAGIDYQMNYRHESAFGTWMPTVTATQTYRYRAALSAGSSFIDGVSKAQGTGNWAPRWKGTAALEWELGAWTINSAGRYVSRYQDYASTRDIGDFWLWDFNVHLDIGHLATMKRDIFDNAFVEAGAINAFDKEIQYSNFNRLLGYDPAQADIRGRFIYGRIGIRF